MRSNAKTPNRPTSATRKARWPFQSSLEAPTVKPARAVLIRIGIDSSYGAWNAPADPGTGEFVYVPIPENESIGAFQPGCARGFNEFIPQLEDFSQRFQFDLDGEMHFPRRKLLDRFMHLDPDFEHLTYGDDGNRRGKVLRTLAEGDLLVFYAGMRSTDLAQKQLIYGIVGKIVVDRISEIKAIPTSQWHQNAHTRKARHGEHDLVVWGKPTVSGRLNRFLPIGEYRDQAYRVRRDLLKLWGGLSNKDGYLQRSGRPPLFLDAGAFQAWFNSQDVPMTETNFDGVRRKKPRDNGPVYPQKHKAASDKRWNESAGNSGRMIVVHLRQPNQSDRNEMRSDPFFEFGSFGCTKCHHRNLMNPQRIGELQGARLAFAQGGYDGFRLVLLTPPVSVVKHEDRCELRWQPVAKPFRYDSAPRLVDKSGETDFPRLRRFIKCVGRSTRVAQFSSNFRTRRKPLPVDVAECISEVYERLASAESQFAKSYADTMATPPPWVDRHRKATYRSFLAQAGAEKEPMGCRPKRRSCR